jgi:hydroxymethylglutaryl-CoA lyase
MKIIECPRDAMQGLREFIPTDVKLAYLQSLLKVGFDTLDCGSFVSPSAIPQMKDTSEILDKLDLSDSKTKLLCIVANKRGAEDAVKFEQISYLGYPFSISETFQRRNTNAGMVESLKTLENIHNLCIQKNKEVVVYISMGFGNPYGDPWSYELVHKWAGQFAGMGFSTISLADTVGLSLPDDIRNLFSKLIPEFPLVEFGAHLHSRPEAWEEKILAAYDCGCRRFDSAMRGFGGCPFANDELTGNIATENLLVFMENRKIMHSLDKEAFREALMYSGKIFH